MCKMLFIHHTTCGHRGFTQTPVSAACGHSCTLDLQHLDVPHDCSKCSDIPAAPEVAGMIPYMRARGDGDEEEEEEEEEEEKVEEVEEEEAYLWVLVIRRVLDRRVWFGSR